MYFKEDHFVNPIFNSNPANTWSEMPGNVQKNLKYVWELLEILCDNIKKPLQINSTWRPRGRSTSAHFDGKAVDIQFESQAIPDSGYIEMMEFLKTTDKVDDFRALLEYRGRRPWIHIDRGFVDVSRRSNRRSLHVMYPKNNKMVFLLYKGKLPQEYMV